MGSGTAPRTGRHESLSPQKPRLLPEDAEAWQGNCISEVGGGLEDIDEGGFLSYQNA